MTGLLRLCRSAFIVFCRIIVCLRLPALCEESSPAASLLPASVKKALLPPPPCLPSVKKVLQPPLHPSRQGNVKLFIFFYLYRQGFTLCCII